MDEAASKLTELAMEIPFTSPQVEKDNDIGECVCVCVDERQPHWVCGPLTLTDRLTALLYSADEVERVIALLLREAGDKLNEEVRSRFLLQPNKTRRRSADFRFALFSVSRC